MNLSYTLTIHSTFIVMRISKEVTKDYKRKVIDN